MTTVGRHSSGVGSLQDSFRGWIPGSDLANDSIFNRRGQWESLTIDSVIFFASPNYSDRIPFDPWLEGDYELS